MDEQRGGKARKVILGWKTPSAMLNELTTGKGEPESCLWMLGDGTLHSSDRRAVALRQRVSVAHWKASHPWTFVSQTGSLASLRGSTPDVRDIQ